MACISKPEGTHRQSVRTDQEYLLQEVDPGIGKEEQEEKDGKPRKLFEETRQVLCQPGAFQEKVRRPCEAQDDETRHLKRQQNQYLGLLEHQN